MRPGTSYVLKDEPCFSLHEWNENGRRYQRLVVVRNDELADYVTDIGPEQALVETRIIGGFRDPVSKRLFIEETVSSIRTIADQDRLRDQNEVTISVPDLLDGYARLKEIVP